MTLDELISQPLGSFADMVRWQAAQRPHHPAVVLDGRQLDYAGFDRLIDAAAASLQQDGITPGDIVAICASTSIEYLATLFACLRAGAAFAPLAPSATAAHRDAMLGNAAAKLLFRDREAANDWCLPADSALPCIALDDSNAGTPWTRWLEASASG